MTEDAAAPTQRAIAFAALLLMGVSAATAPHPILWIRLAPPLAAVGLAVFGWLRPGPGAAVAVLGAAVSAIAVTGILWQATMPLALAVFWVVARIRPGLSAGEMRMGRVPVGGTLGCAAVTPVALVAWFTLFHPDLSNITEGMPKVGPILLVVGAMGFAVINALGEELIWRGVIQTRLTALLPARDAIFLQALSFGAQHAHGFPRGAAGVALAGTWAIGLGMLREKAGGLLASTLAHIVADATIASIVLFTMR